MILRFRSIAAIVVVGALLFVPLARAQAPSCDARPTSMTPTTWRAPAAVTQTKPASGPHAHTVSVDPRTHRVYLPLENVGGRPVLRIYEVFP